MAETKRGPVRIGVDLVESYEMRFPTGLVATNGVVYSPVATFGTIAFDVVNMMVDPGFNGRPQYTEIGLTQKFTEVASANASLGYYLLVREENVATLGAYFSITGTYQKGIAANANSEDTFSGYIDRASLPQIPFRIRLVAQGLVANSMVGQIKNSSFIRGVATVIPTS